jgi:hypothetical protein
VLREIGSTLPSQVYSPRGETQVNMLFARSDLLHAIRSALYEARFAALRGRLSDDAVRVECYAISS